MLALLLSTAPLPGATRDWFGALDGDWATADNWSVLPADSLATDIARFNNPFYDEFLVYSPVLSGNYSINGLIISGTNDAMVLGGAGNLSIGSNGTVINSGAGAFTMNLTTVTLGAAQAWTNNSANLFTVNSAVVNGANTLTVNGTGNTLINGVIGSGNGGLAKSGSGNLTLTQANTYTGNTTVNGGNLLLDFSAAGAPADNILSTSSRLVLGGGNLTLQGAASTTHNQTFNGVIVNAAQGGNTLSATSGANGTIQLTLGAITRNAGAGINFVLPSSGALATTSTNTNGILGPWATVDGTDYATVTGGNIVALNVSASTEDSWTSPTDNYTANAATTLTGNRSAHSLRYTGAAGSLDFGGNTFTLDGLLNGGSGNLTLANGTLAIGASGELVLNGAQPIQIGTGLGGVGTVTFLGTGPFAFTGNTTALSANQTWQNNSADLLTLAGALDLGSNTLILSGLSGTAVGAVTGSGGRLVATSASSLTGSTLALGNGTALELRNNSGTTFAASSLDLSGTAHSLLVGRAGAGVGVTHILTLVGATSPRLALGQGGNTTLDLGANVNANSTYTFTINTTNATSTAINGTHTFNVNNNGTGLGTVQLTQAVAGTPGVQDTIVKQGAGQLLLSTSPSFNAGDGDRIDLEAGTVSIGGTSHTNMTVNFLANGVRLDTRNDSTWNATTTLHFAADGALTSPSSNPTYSAVLTGNGNITVSGGQFVQYFTPNANSTWMGTLIAGAGGRGHIRIGNSNLNYDGVKGISHLILTGATGFSDPALVDSMNTGLVRIRTNVTVGGLSSAGNGLNTRLASNGVTSNVSVAQTLTINLTGANRTYEGALSDGFSGSNAGSVGPDLSTLRILKTGNGTQTLSGQTYLSNYSGGTEIQEGTLVVLNGGASIAGIVGSNGTANITSGNGRVFSVADTTGLYVGKAVTLLNGNPAPANLFISAISGSNVTITNRSGGTVATLVGDNTFDFGATSPTGTGPISVGPNGTLAGTAYLRGDVTNNGTVSPGTSAGVLTLAGNYTQTPTGALTIEIGARPDTPSLWDRLVAAGSAAVDGVLNILFNAGNTFTGVIGDVWKFVTAGTRTGNFTTTNISATGLPGGSELVVQYVADGVELHLQAVGGGNVTYATWSANISFPVGESDPEDDPDRDGNDNLVEYGFDTDPLVPDADHPNLPVALVVTDSGNDYLAIQFTKPAGDDERSDLTYTPERATALGSGSFSGTGVVLFSSDAPAEPETLIYRSSTPISGADREFLRVFLELP